MSLWLTFAKLIEIYGNFLSFKKEFKFQKLTKYKRVIYHFEALDLEEQNMNLLYFYSNSTLI